MSNTLWSSPPTGDTANGGCRTLPSEKLAELRGRHGARLVSPLVALALGLLVAQPAMGVVFSFENPQPGSYHSGITVLSGLVCDAEKVTVEITGASSTEVIEMSYGTPRLDAHVSNGGPCNKKNTGFGGLTNLNRLGTGPATAVLKVDGVAVGKPRVFNITRPTPDNFNRDIDGAYTLPDFPKAGQAVDVVFQKSTQNFGIAPAGATANLSTPAAVGSNSCPKDFATQCVLENPGIAQFVSGIIVFSGWVCDVTSDLRLVLEGAATTETIVPAYPTARGDTLGTCQEIDNGFGALSNVNRLGDGPATAELWIDGVLAVSYDFWVTQPSAVPFGSDIAGEFRLPGFPDDASDTFLIWQKSLQNFAIKSVAPTAGPTPTPAPGSIPTPGITPTPSPVPTPTSDGSPTPTSDGGATPTPTPGGGSGAVCGNGIVEGTEQCDGADLGDATECTDVYDGFNPDGPDDCLAGSVLRCNPDCTYDGTLCSCVCEFDIDCALPAGFNIDCGPMYCTTEFCAPVDLPDCECLIGEDGFVASACLGSNDTTGQLGQCIVTPFDPGENDANLTEVCLGVDGGDPDSPRCDACDF